MKILQKNDVKKPVFHCYKTIFREVVPKKGQTSPIGPHFKVLAVKVQ